MKIITAPSILACDFLHLENEIKRAEDAGADTLHADVMDGVYVPNISFGFDIIKKICSITHLPLDVHMMTVCPYRYIDRLADIGVSSVTVHHDIADTGAVCAMLDDIRAHGMTPAVSLRPSFPADDIIPFIGHADRFLVMTVEPGFGGQEFMHDMLPKIARIRSILDEHSPDSIIQVDGGINAETAALCAKAGAENFVIGTASFGAPDMKAVLCDIRCAAEQVK